MMTEVLTAEARLSQATILLNPAAMKARVISSTAEPVIFAGPGCQATDTDPLVETGCSEINDVHTPHSAASHAASRVQ